MMPLWLVLKGLSSNKQDTESQIEIESKGKKDKKGKVLYKDMCYAPLPGQVAVLKPIIDKVALTYKFANSDPDLKPALIQGLLLDAEEKTHFKSAGQFKSGAVKYAASVKLIVPPLTEEVLVQVGPKKPGLKHDLRIEFNPHRLGSSGIAFMKSQLEAVVVGGLDFGHVLSTGKVTRVDIAVDIVGIRIDALDIQFSGDGKSHWYFSSSGQPETGYLGIKQTDKNAPWKAYNKRKQLKEKSGAVDQLYGGLSHTRIEFHAKPYKSVAGLKSLANPFINISVAHAIAPKGVKPHAWQFFLDACQRRGHKEALALIPEGPAKLRYTKALQAAHDAFWRPDKIWAAWEEALVKAGMIQT